MLGVLEGEEKKLVASTHQTNGREEVVSKADIIDSVRTKGQETSSLVILCIFTCFSFD